MTVKEKLLEIRAYCKSVGSCANCKYFNSACDFEGITPWDWTDQTIDWIAAELGRPKARWRKDSNPYPSIYVYCSECGYAATEIQGMIYKYCPNCGAEMEE